MQLCDAHKGSILSPDGSVSAFTDDYCAIVFEGNSFDSTVRTSKCDLLLASGMSYSITCMVPLDQVHVDGPITMVCPRSLYCHVEGKQG